MQRNNRLRIFAGPNGSGKSTLFDEFKKHYNPGYFINADEFEKQLNSTGLIDLRPIGIKGTQKDLASYKKTTEAKSLIKKATSENHEIDIELKENFIVDKQKDVHSYEASFTASFIRWLLYKNKKSFSFETVMSHPSKLKEIKNAKTKGYKIYLYFICTENSKINIDRVAKRVDKGGHHVDSSKIRSRYNSTLLNLYPAIRLSDKIYLFDNSSKKLELIATIFEKSLKLLVDKQPNWFIKYVLPHFIK